VIEKLDRQMQVALLFREMTDEDIFPYRKKIATSYPYLVKWLSDKQVDVDSEISGSVEIAPGIGLADAICDLVSSGSTLFMNGLKEAETILNSQAVSSVTKSGQTTGGVARQAAV
jgi:ATP phosphoribosyltransferase